MVFTIKLFNNIYIQYCIFNLLENVCARTRGETMITVDAHVLFNFFTAGVSKVQPIGEIQPTF